MKKVYVFTEEQLEKLKHVQTRILSHVELGLNNPKSDSGNLLCIQELAEEIGCILTE